MERPAEIGSTIVIKGDITAQEDLVISGRVEGSISAEGHAVTVNEGAEVVAEVHARAITVAGQVMGHLSAGERLELRQTADVEGELSAPVLKVTDGAVFQGKAKTTGDAKPALQLAS
jgi:cytoskeletal protein CcmA (bactofilin family)